MEKLDVCTPRIAESDVQTNVTGPLNAAFVIDADKVINSKTGSTQVKERSDEELLKGLLTDAYCHVCSSVLMFESHRLSHYKGKKHNQKVRMYLESARAEKTPKSQEQTMSSSKNRFCELCNMVFNSDVVAKSHYEGKVHAKHLRKQSLHPPEVHASSSLTQNPEKSDQKSAQESDEELQMHTTAASASTSSELNLKDPNKYCCLCTVSFTDSLTAMQHYNGRKHQKKQAVQELLKELGDDEQLDDSLVCHRCDVKLNSVETYQAHMQGNKHQIKGKKINDLFKCQPKAYSTFADELADYIQAQKARGVTPKISQTLPQEGTGEEEDDQEVFTDYNDLKSSESVRGFTQNHQQPHQLTSGLRLPSYPGPAWPACGWDRNYPPPPLPFPGVTLFPSQPTGHRRPRAPSSSCTSSSYSSDSSHTSSSDDSEHRVRERRRKRKSRRDRSAKEGDEDSDMEERRRKHRRRKRRRRERDYDTGEVRRDPCVESVEEGRSKRIKSHNKQRQQEKQQENFETGGKNQTEDVMENRNETRLQAETNTDQRERRHRAAKPKYGKEKKKSKEKVDLRTEEEKLWDDSILGC